jgi:hypothetical protein
MGIRLNKSYKGFTNKNPKYFEKVSKKTKQLRAAFRRETKIKLGKSLKIRFPYSR